MRKAVVGLALSLSLLATPVWAARCGNTSAGFEDWKAEFAAEAKANGVNPKAFNAYPRFRMMMKEEAQAHRIPRPMVERMKAAGHGFNSGD